MNFVSTNIKYLRKKHRLSQCELADRIGLKRGNIASYEKSIAEPKILNLNKLACYFQVTIGDFVTIDLSNETATKNNEPKVEAVIEPILAQDEFQRIMRDCNEFENIISGMSCYHNFRMNQIKEHTEDIKMLSSEVERLLSVAKCLVDSHKYLIEKIDNHDNCIED